MISTSEFRNGLTIELDGEAYVIVDFQHVKPGKGAAFVRSKLRNARTGTVMEKTFRAGEKVNRAHVDRRGMQFLYHSGEAYVFMDAETFEQRELSGELLGEATRFLKENTDIQVALYEGQVISVDLPNSVELRVVETPPGVKGDTAAGGSKEARLETGALVQVPLFVDEGDVVRVDTRSGEYLERV